MSNSADTARQRLRNLLPRCYDCRVNRVPETGMLCPYCQRLEDARKKRQAQAAAFIQAHGQAAWDAKLERDTKELY